MTSPAIPAPAPAGDETPRVARLARMLTAGVVIRSFSITVIALLGILYTLYFAKPLILPIVLALMLSLLLVPLVRVLHARCRIPVALSAGIVLVALVGSLLLAASFVIEPASAWVRTIPDKIPELKTKLRLMQRPLEKVREATQQVNDLARFRDGSEPAVVKVTASETPVAVVMNQTPGFFANLFVMFILLYFMLASGDLFLRKLVRIVPTFEDKRHAVEIAREIEERISTYLRTVTVINLCLGLAVGTAACFVGLQNYVFWGVLAFALNFVPYIGAFAGILATLVVSLLSFESTSYAFVMPAIYLALNILEGNFLTPFIVGRILTLNPVMIFLFLMFWGWIWGVAGALLAVPLLAIVKIVCDHLAPLQPLGDFIGGEATD